MSSDDLARRIYTFQCNDNFNLKRYREKTGDKN